MFCDLLFNLGLNTCRETNIILSKFKSYLINSIRDSLFIYHLVIVAYLNLSNFLNILCTTVLCTTDLKFLNSFHLASLSIF